MADTVSRVYIVGAGPGDPELLTRKACRLLREANVVVYDKLVSDGILDLIPPGVTRIFAGKVARHHYMPQNEINALLVNLAQTGHTVVRLKGGDPFMFGRGGEEAMELAAHGVPFEVVPGVTAASGCSAYAGIPLTHRDLSHSVIYVTGHAKDNEPLNLNWRSLADPETTLVLYMGRTNIRRIASGLMDHGLAGDTPAAAVVNGTRPEQRVLIATLAKISECVERLDEAAPTLIFVGRVVSLANVLSWFSPDTGKETTTDLIKEKG